MEKKTIRELLIEFFKSHPNEDMPHGPVVDWVEERYLKIYNKKFQLFSIMHLDQK